MQAVILAGGRGERLRPLTDTIPKPLVKIGRKPLLEHQILLLKRYNIKEIWILSGYLGEKIKNYFGTGKKWDVSIYHLIEKEPLGTAGALKQLEGLIKSNFLVFSGDVILDIDLDSLIKFHKKQRGSVATIVVHPNDHPFDSDLVDVDLNSRVKEFLIRKNKVHPRNILFKNLTNAGVFLFSPKIFDYIASGEKNDIEKDVFLGILGSGGKIYAYNTPEYIKDMGTVMRLSQVKADFKSGKTKRFNKKNKRPAIFLDRDGTINEMSGQKGVKFANFRLFPFSGDAIKKINRSEYLAIVVTNQPGIAKGMITLDENEKINKKFETQLGRSGAKIDAIYFCPHHPEKGFSGEIKELKIGCSCRKPRTGLIRKAVRDFNIDLTRSFLIGDSTVDAKLAQNAAVKFVGVRTGYALADNRQSFSTNKFKVKNNFEIKNNLLDAVDFILG